MSSAKAHRLVQELNKQLQMYRQQEEMRRQTIKMQAELDREREVLSLSLLSHPLIFMTTHCRLFLIWSSNTDENG